MTSRLSRTTTHKCSVKKSEREKMLEVKVAALKRKVKWLKYRRSIEEARLEKLWSEELSKRLAAQETIHELRTRALTDLDGGAPAPPPTSDLTSDSIGVGKDGREEMEGRGSRQSQSASSSSSSSSASLLQEELLPSRPNQDDLCIERCPLCSDDIRNHLFNTRKDIDDDDDEALLSPTATSSQREGSTPAAATFVATDGNSRVKVLCSCGMEYDAAAAVQQDC